MLSFSVFAIITVLVTSSSALVVKTNTDDLIAVVQIYRHGQKNPVSWYTNDPWKNSSLWEQGPGQLTKRGKVQHYELGKFTRRRYGTFLPREYNPSWFRAQTTDVDRTHMSCQSNLAGIFIPTRNETWKENLPWQPIPVHPIDEEVLSTFTSCGIYVKELANVFARDPFYVALNSEFADVYAYISNYTGDKITSVFSAYIVFDTLLVEDQFGLELPSWTKSVYPEPLETLAAYSLLGYSYTTEMKRLVIGRWLNTAIYEYFLNIFNGTPSFQKFQMWSAHDINIASTLNTLGAFDVHIPAFASTIYFELRNKSGTPYINIWHRDDDLDIFEPITVKGCSFHCALEDFRTAISNYLLDADTYATECAANSTSFTESEKVMSDAEVTQIIEHVEKIIKCKKDQKF